MPVIIPAASSADLAAFRLELGDLNEDDYLFTDAQASYFIAARPSSVLLAVADACDALARRFAREFDFDTTSEKSFKRSQKAKAYREMATDLRARATLEAGGGLGVIITTRADGYSDDLDTRDSAGLLANTGRTQYGGPYYDADLP